MIENLIILMRYWLENHYEPRFFQILIYYFDNNKAKIIRFYNLTYLFIIIPNLFFEFIFNITFNAKQSTLIHSDLICYKEQDIEIYIWHFLHDLYRSININEYLNDILFSPFYKPIIESNFSEYINIAEYFIYFILINFKTYDFKNKIDKNTNLIKIKQQLQHYMKIRQVFLSVVYRAGRN